MPLSPQTVASEHVAAGSMANTSDLKTVVYMPKLPIILFLKSQQSPAPVRPVESFIDQPVKHRKLSSLFSMKPCAQSV